MGSQSGADIALLKSWNFSAWSNQHPGTLPYGIDRLENLGYHLHWTDRIHQEAWEGSRRAALLGRLEARSVPFVQTGLMARAIRSSAATLAFFESEANCLALTRSATGVRRPPLLVISCWLAQILADSARPRRQAYRWAYRSVDRLYFFSRNQEEVLDKALRLPPGRLRYLPFGIDAEFFAPPGEEDHGYVLAVGRDRGRDWRLFFEAVEGLDLPVKVCCRPSDIAGLTVPSNVEVLGYVDRETYKVLLGGARVVAVITRSAIYPSGQSVLLEAMAMARAVVVTGTRSIEDYVRDGVNCLTVPVGDSMAVRNRIRDIACDPDLRVQLGNKARAAVEERYTSDRMWDQVAADLMDLGVCPS